jgi:hypothetical protein
MFAMNRVARRRMPKTIRGQFDFIIVRKPSRHEHVFRRSTRVE